MRRSIKMLWPSLSVLLLSVAHPAIADAKPVSGAKCAALSAGTIPDAHIVSAGVVAAGKFVPSGTRGGSNDLAARMATMPAFCRIVARAEPTTDSNILIEVWLPLTKWNGRFLGTGNGGAAGSIAYGMGMIEGLKRGFATANTDMGVGPDIAIQQQHPERWIDFGNRSTHEMTRVSKALVSSFYTIKSFRAYFEGCSTGGQQALVTAQRHPDDYDGILAGDPGSNRTHSTSYFLWNYLAVNATPQSALAPAQWSMLTRAVVAACGGRDGGAPGDRFLTDPRRCRFDPASLPQCSAGASVDDCLTPPQLATVRRLYAGAVNPRTGERIYPGLTLGAEDSQLGPLRMSNPAVLDRLFILRWGMGADFPAAKFDFDHDMDRLDARLSSAMNANDSDLGDFRRRGGKLMMYSGLADAGVPFDDVVSYYNRVVATSGVDVGRGFARLFLVPGMDHCLGGAGVTDIGQPFSPQVPEAADGDALMALVAWTEGGVAPTRIIAHKPADDHAPAQERPICAYPALPEYQRGNPAKRQSFMCVDHGNGGIQDPAPRYIN
ncbi:tannase/feruloyl esterase family alpha/beta hydrolase [soil metagenome]